MDKYYPTISIVSDGMNYLQGNNIWFGQLPNVTAVSPTDLTWESTETFNAGLDLSLLNGKLTLTADAYVKTQMTYYFQSLMLPLLVSAVSLSKCRASTQQRIRTICKLAQYYR